MEIAISEDGFLNMLTTLNKGALVEELDNELINAVQSIMDHKGKAEIKVTFKLTRIKNMETAVSIESDVVVKLPKEKRPEKAMFINGSGGLVNQHQEQIALDMRPATREQSTLKPAASSNVSNLKPANNQ